MKILILIIYALICTVTTSPFTNAATSDIHLQVTEDSPTKLSLTLEARAISKPLIGISTVLHLPSNVKYINHTPGQFFESTKQQVSYIISPKKNDPQTIVLGIASLGKTSTAEAGTIVTLHFQKTSPNVSLTNFILANSIASGVDNNQRINYPDILWSIDQTLTPVGTSLVTAIILTLLLTSIVFVSKYRIVKQRVSPNL